jgi:DNA-binding transcriptional regulator LsrR (DeoR family)
VPGAPARISDGCPPISSVAQRIAIPYGIERLPAVLTAWPSGLINSMVTYVSTAKSLLSASERPNGGSSVRG